MKPIFSLFAIALALGGTFQSYAQSADKFLPYPLVSSRLSNGLTVVRVSFPSPGLVAYYSVVRVGSRNEVEPGHTGFAHFFEHMMFKGTRRYPEGARERLLSQLGFNDNAFTADDVTVFHSYGPSSGLEQLVTVEADRFEHLNYSEAAFQTEAKAVLGEYLKGAAHPEQKLEEALAAAAFTRHPYRHTTLGFYQDILTMPQKYAYSREFFRRWYTPDNTLVFVVGDFNDDELMQWVEKHYGPWNGQVASVPIPSEPRQVQERTVRLDWPTPTLPRLVSAWHTPETRADTFSGPIQTLLGSYLAGPTSPAYQQLVLEKQLAESIFSGFSDHRNPTLFTLHALVKNERDLPAVRSTLDAEIAKLASGDVDVRRMNDIKSNQSYGLLMSWETADQVALQLVYLTGITNEPEALDSYYRHLKELTPQQLVSFAQKYLVKSNRTLLTLTSKSANATKGAHP